MSRTISTDILRDYAEMLAREGHSYDAGAVLNAIAYCSKQEPGVSDTLFLYYPGAKEIHILRLKAQGDEFLQEFRNAGCVGSLDYAVEDLETGKCHDGLYLLNDPVSAFVSDEKAAEHYEMCRELDGEPREYYRLISEKEYEKITGHSVAERNFQPALRIRSV